MGKGKRKEKSLGWSKEKVTQRCRKGGKSSEGEKKVEKGEG